MPRLLITGAGGFLGHHALRHFLTETDWDVVCTDSFRHEGKTDRISLALEHGPAEWRDRVTVITHDLAAPISYQMGQRIGRIDYIAAYASLSDVDASIAEPARFIRNNVDVALSVLDYARNVQPRAVVWVSTDEVYGPVERHSPGHREWAPVLPSNPYSASKAAQEAIAISYWRTYGLPLVVVNCMNLIGEGQAVTKFVPKTIAAVRDGREVTIHGQPGNIGTRHYLHARNLADAILHIFRNLPPAMFPAHSQRRLRLWREARTLADRAATENRVFTEAEQAMWDGLNERLDAETPAVDRPDRYNVASADRLTNLDLARMVAEAMDLPLHYRLEDFHTTRPGHDPHYGLDPAKLEGLGWKPPVPFTESLERTVAWSLAHPEWLLP